VREKKRELSPRRREEIEAIQKAIEEENERISSARSKPTTIESAITQRGSYTKVYVDLHILLLSMKRKT